MKPSSPPPQVLQLTPSVRVGASLDFIADDLGGRESFISACRLSEDSRVQEFVAIYDQSTSSDSLHDICTKAGLTIPDLIGLTLASQIVLKNNLSLWISALSRPKVMTASIESALILGAEGFADRQMQLKLGGLVPKEGGINIINQMSVGVRTPGIPGFEERARITTEAVRGTLSLPSHEDVDPTSSENIEVPDIT